MVGNKQDIRLFYISSHSVFTQGAASNRLLCFIRGFNDLGYKAKLLHSIPTYQKVFNADNIDSDCIVSYKVYKKKYSFICKSIFSLLSIVTAYKCYLEVIRTAKKYKTYIVCISQFGKTDARHSTFCSTSAGLLAIKSFSDYKKRFKS